MSHLHVIILLKRFLTVEQCPREWRPLDLYLFRDEEIVFYVGQSYVAFERVWQHVRDGFKGRSAIGRFILCIREAGYVVQAEDRKTWLTQ